MRSFEPIFDTLDVIKLTCPFSKCNRTFYTNNSKALFCCDSHRGKYFREVNAQRLKDEKDYTVGFSNNAKALNRLYHSAIRHCNERELIIAGFNFKTMGQPKRTQDGRVCYKFFDFILIEDKIKSGVYLIDIVTKK